MKITLNPIRMDAQLSASVSGDVLNINGNAFDLSAYSECEWIIGEPENIDGVWHVTVLLPHGADAPDETRFPAPIIATDGPVPLPPYTLEPEDV